MRSSLFRRLGLLPALLAFLVAACGTTVPTEPTPTPDPTPAPVMVTETFEDTVVFGGEKVHLFTVSAGIVTTTLTAVEPDAAPELALGVGTWDATAESCELILLSETAVPGTALVGTATTKVTLCVKVYDIGTIEEGGSVNYQVKVNHPE